LGAALGAWPLDQEALRRKAMGAAQFFPEAGDGARNLGADAQRTRRAGILKHAHIQKRQLQKRQLKHCDVSFVTPDISLANIRATKPIFAPGRPGAPDSPRRFLNLPVPRMVRQYSQASLEGDGREAPKPLRALHALCPSADAVLLTGYRSIGARGFGRSRLSDLATRNRQKDTHIERDGIPALRRSLPIMPFTNSL
jgi:hypothetical protein